MIIYSGLGYLVLILFVAAVVIVGSILYWGFGIDPLRSSSWWPLHSMMLLGAILTCGVGLYANRNKVEEITYEKSGPVKVLRKRHTLYFLPMEYWGPIVLAIYFGVLAYYHFK